MTVNFKTAILKFYDHIERSVKYSLNEKFYKYATKNKNYYC